MDYYTMLAVARAVIVQYQSLGIKDSTGDLLDWIDGRMEDENEVRRILKDGEDLRQRQGPPFRF